MPIWTIAVCVFLSCCFPGCILSAIVSLDSIEIYNTHELFERPTVYFKCKGDNKTVLPDVKEKKVFYKFNGQESWQPLTKIDGKKCKRCGFYEQDIIKSDDVFEEWELCPSDFGGKGKIYHRITKDEFNATFVCPQCDTSGSKSNNKSHEEGKGSRLYIALVVLIVAAVLAACIAGGIVGYKHWQKKKRQQEQARFLKLFEDGDELEDELGLDHVM